MEALGTCPKLTLRVGIATAATSHVLTVSKRVSTLCSICCLSMSIITCGQQRYRPQSRRAKDHRWSPCSHRCQYQVIRDSFWHIWMSPHKPESTPPPPGATRTRTQETKAPADHFPWWKLLNSLTEPVQQPSAGADSTKLWYADSWKTPVTSQLESSECKKVCGGTLQARRPL